MQISEEISASYFQGNSHPDLLKTIGAFRYQVWNHEGFQPGTSGNGTWLDRYDPFASHWVVYRANQIIGSARLSIHTNAADVPDANDFMQLGISYPPPIASLNRLVVCPTSRGKGIARWLDQQRIEHAQKLGAKTIIAEVPVYRVSTLTKQGFVEIGTCYDAQFPHLKWHMVIRCSFVLGPHLVDFQQVDHTAPNPRGSS
jgi:GNAT superfamily N-acetyltransferase